MYWILIGIEGSGARVAGSVPESETEEFYIMKVSRACVRVPGLAGPENPGIRARPAGFGDRGPGSGSSVFQIHGVIGSDYSVYPHIAH